MVTKCSKLADQSCHRGQQRPVNSAAVTSPNLTIDPRLGSDKLPPVYITSMDTTHVGISMGLSGMQCAYILPREPSVSQHASEEVGEQAARFGQHGRASARRIVARHVGSAFSRAVAVHDGPVSPKGCVRTGEH
eukprot:968170-Pleurochrysis_carterae.AAC.2